MSVCKFLCGPNKMSIQAEREAKRWLIESQEQRDFSSGRGLKFQNSSTEFHARVLQLGTVFQFPGDHKQGWVLQVQLASSHSVMPGVTDIKHLVQEQTAGNSANWLRTIRAAFKCPTDILLWSMWAGSCLVFWLSCSDFCGNPPWGLIHSVGVTPASVDYPPPHPFCSL